jgi:hypothetical protein
MFRTPFFNYSHNDIIAKKLLEHCPELDLNGVEKQILLACKDDLVLYIMYLQENKMVVDELFIEYFATFVLNTDLGIEHSIQPILSDDKELIYRDDSETFADRLVDEWWKKFQIRTKIQMVKPDMPPMAMGMGVNRVIFNPSEMDDLRRYVAIILLKNGERCFIDLMIHNLIAQVIGTKVSPNKASFTEQDKLQLVQAIGFEAKQLTQKSGPLIFLYADKNYYKAHMREWRSDGNGQVL